MKVLAAIRLFAGLTQKDAAKMLGVANTTVSMWEVGDSKPPIDMVPRIAEAYNVPANVLFEYFTGKQIQVTYSVIEST